MPSVQKIATHLTIMKEVSNLVAFKISDAVFQVAEILRQAKKQCRRDFRTKETMEIIEMTKEISSIYLTNFLVRRQEFEKGSLIASFLTQSLKAGLVVKGPTTKKNA